MCRFRYFPSYLDSGSAFAIDPVQLPPGEGVYETPRDSEYFNGVRDSCPDAWGDGLLELAAAEAGIELKETDYMLHAGPDRIGALGFSSAPGIPPFSEEPPWSGGKPVCGEELPLEKLAEAAACAAAGMDVPGGLSRFIAAGSAAGGAQPKAAVRISGIACLAKFPRPEDAWRACRAEAACMELAAACGIDAAEASCISLPDGAGDVLLVRRFDRKICGGAEWRIPFASEMTLCGLPEHAPDASYQDMARAAGMPFYDAAFAGRDRLELFRRMCFNALSGSCDDHARNQAFCWGREAGGCRRPTTLRPAFRMGSGFPASAWDGWEEP